MNSLFAQSNAQKAISHGHVTLKYNSANRQLRVEVSTLCEPHITHSVWQLLANKLTGHSTCELIQCDPGRVYRFKIFSSVTEESYQQLQSDHDAIPKLSQAQIRKSRQESFRS